MKIENITEQIRKLAYLKTAGILTEEEFRKKKTEFLSPI
ncbi:SHOCT domain-containing protein [Clostridium botulinum]|nr:SHOCT domain-containing protein [Clostridium botulinum]